MIIPRVGEKRRGDPEDTNRTDPGRLPSPPSGVSRVDTLPPDFIALLSKRPLVPGDVLAGRYKLLESLGDGAMGQVFVAENQAIGRRVAIKLLKAELLADSSFRQRFQQEAMANAAVEHRNVARFIDLVVGDPTFLVMEYVPGPTLYALLKKEGALEWRRAVGLGVRLCWGLDAAHARGIIHRDVKPANVIITPDEELGEEPKLIDFGLAKLPTLVGAENLTRTGQIVGTPQYMSPEQIANKAVDARSDVYALGCLLYHMLSGSSPFAGGEDVQVLYKQIEEVPALLGGKVPPAVAHIVARALAKRPEQRFPTARSLARALAAELDQQPAQDPLAKTVNDQAPAAPARRPRRMVAGVAAALALAGATGAVVHRIDRAPSSGGSALMVTSRPAGATVFLDGARQAESAPSVISGVSAGAHKLRAELAGRTAAEQMVQLTAGQRLAIELSLPAASRQVRVESVPSGGIVFVDGLQVPGETPLVATLDQEDYHQISVEKSGYEPAKRSIKPEDAADSITLTLDPEREPRGRLIVDSSDGAEVWIDGKSTGFLTPTIAMRLTAGSHHVELRDSASGRSTGTEVKIRQGETARMTLQFPVKP
jgi:serine/threonine-protein kinase